MKVKQLNENEKAFKPIEIVITIESKNELDCLGSLFNHRDVADSMIKMCNLKPSEFYNLLNSLGANISRVGELNLTSKSNTP